MLYSLFSIFMPWPTRREMAALRVLNEHPGIPTKKFVALYTPKVSLGSARTILGNLMMKGYVRKYELPLKQLSDPSLPSWYKIWGYRLTAAGKLSLQTDKSRRLTMMPGYWN